MNSAEYKEERVRWGRVSQEIECEIECESVRESDGKGRRKRRVEGEGDL
jgi:hypothetical protein